MPPNEIGAQLVGVVLIALTLLAPQAKSRSGMLLLILLANLLSCVQFILVDARAGVFALIVTTVRSVVFWAYASKDKKAPVAVFVLFAALQTAATFVGWEGWLSALTLCLLLNTYGQWQTDEKTLRICLLFSALIFGVYCFGTHAYTGAINKWLQAASTVVAIARFGQGNTRGKCD
jgi:uncharacterized membrane protein YoaT (DUF817 family)